MIGTISVRAETIPVGDGALPVGDGALPVGDGALPVGDGAFPVGDGAFPVGDGAFPVGDGAFPVVIGSIFALIGAIFVVIGSIAVRMEVTRAKLYQPRTMVAIAWLSSEILPWVSECAGEAYTKGLNLRTGSGNFSTRSVVDMNLARPFKAGERKSRVDASRSDAGS